MRVPGGEGDWVRGSGFPTMEIHFAPGGRARGSAPGRVDQLHFHPLRHEFDLQKGWKNIFITSAGLSRSRRMRCNRILISRCKAFGEQSANLGNAGIRALSTRKKRVRAFREEVDTEVRAKFISPHRTHRSLVYGYLYDN